MSRFPSIDVQRLRWFAAVAQELHFARAAKALHISRQKLSHTVIDLETELGTKLFVPGAQPTRLTDAGRELLREAREIIARTEGETATTADAVPAPLRVGFVPGVTVTKWERIWGQRFPDTALELVAVAQADQEAALRAGLVDMCFVRLPIDRTGMNAIPLYRELPVVVVPKDHEISLFDEVGMADLAGERLQDTADIDAAKSALELVAAGVGVAIVPHSIARLHHRRDLVYRTVTDADDTQIALAWLSDQAGDSIEEFIGIVRGRSEHSSRSPAAKRAEPEPRKPQPAGKRPHPAKKPGTSKRKPARGRRR
ncbi:LysR family transcriptional regulator [Nocardia flavorosea]|uniref:LysR family transcriptional regulator n=1 Tax=Nocardia flavorosea TaxID=53429 RepID=UPI001896260D|nr:LysR substrate-binding domain-containing protein [Nocardia flavorosea]MBF6347411.1 LysR family transcriptional regulator [Nocardia flavorosea]